MHKGDQQVQNKVVVIVGIGSRECIDLTEFRSPDPDFVNPAVNREANATYYR